MKYTSIRIEGSILSADLIDKIEAEGSKMKGQAAKDFLLPETDKVKDEIALVWATVQRKWEKFQYKIDRLQKGNIGTSETRNDWVKPLLYELGYGVDLAKPITLNDRSYAISHHDEKRDGFPIHIMSIQDSLDKKREEGGPRLSPHGLMQEYLNLTEHLYGLVTNGKQIRLLRDSSRLIRLSFLEFDLEKMLEEGLFADFAIFYRLLHASRMPVKRTLAADSLIENYHLDALEDGGRIRDGLSAVVKENIIALGNGLINHPQNAALKALLESGKLAPKDFYNELLRLIYRMLFLMVTEERDLIYPKEGDKRKRKIYYDYYSLQALRKLAEKRYLADERFEDYWIQLQHTFQLFEADKFGKALDLKPLAGQLFGTQATYHINNCALDNKTLMNCLRKFSVFKDPKSNAYIRVNYGALNTEEFGSIYEGLLEFDASYSSNGFSLVLGEDRSSSGAHYTPDELVKPLIQHSLDYQIETARKAPEPEKALLALRVCDVACGSGHILLNAARRIAHELAVVRTHEEQPSPTAFRQAIRDAIRHCIYGVDLNPLAVELCKVALWLEAHNPNEPLNFLDHHIKCGNAIVGLAYAEEFNKGIPEEAFKKLAGDDKEVIKEFADRNKKERKAKGQLTTYNTQTATIPMDKVLAKHNAIVAMPEDSPEAIQAKEQAYQTFADSEEARRVKILADMQIAQFFIPKTDENRAYLITTAEYDLMLGGKKALQSQGVAKAMALGEQKHFFHWFLEFPQVMAEGGFDCILGNPPFLGGLKLSTHYGVEFLNFIHTYYSPTKGTADLVTYFFRRIFSLIKKNGFQSLISTNTIAQGGSREGGLAVIVEKEGVVNHAVRSMRWPGLAAVEVALVTIHKGIWKGELILDQKEVKQITTYLDDQEVLPDPLSLKINENKSFIGSYVLGKGFVLEPQEAHALIEKDPKNKEVLFPYLNGQDLNNNIDQSPSRWVINFFDWSEEKAKEYPDCYQRILELVKPERDKNKRKPRRELWWRYAEAAPKLYKTIKPLERVLVVAKTTKFCLPIFAKSDQVFTQDLTVFSYSSYLYLAYFTSTFLTEWAWKNSATMGGSTIRLNPNAVFETYPFPDNNIYENKLLEIGEVYDNSRQKLIESLQLGLTKTYNQFHNAQLTTEVEDLSSKEFPKKYGKETWNLYNHLEKKKAGKVSFQEAVPLVEELRRLHQQMDQAVLEAYGWADIQLRHDFYEVEYLPENDRVRFTIHPAARKEVLKRLLLLNHERAKEEQEAAKSGKPVVKDTAPKPAKTSKKPKKSTTPAPVGGMDLFAKQHEVKVNTKFKLVAANGTTRRYYLVMQAEAQKANTAFEPLSIDQPLAQLVFNRPHQYRFEFEGEAWELQIVG